MTGACREPIRGPACARPHVAVHVCSEITFQEFAYAFCGWMGLDDLAEDDEDTET